MKLIERQRRQKKSLVKSLSFLTDTEVFIDSPIRTPIGRHTKHCDFPKVIGIGSEFGSGGDRVEYICLSPFTIFYRWTD